MFSDSWSVPRGGCGHVCRQRGRRGDKGIFLPCLLLCCGDCEGMQDNIKMSYTLYTDHCKNHWTMLSGVAVIKLTRTNYTLEKQNKTAQIHYSTFTLKSTHKLKLSRKQLGITNLNG